MPAWDRAVPVLQVADVEKSLRWFADTLGFSGDPFPDTPPYSFAILRRDGAEIMLQCADAAGRRTGGKPDPVFRWTIYLRAAGTSVLDLAAAVAKKTPLLRGPERMFYGLVEFELCDPDGHRVCVGGEAPAGANVPLHEE